MQTRTILKTSGVIGALAVAAGAAHAHGLEDALSGDQYDWWGTATHYAILHALALLGCGALSAMGWRVTLSARAILLGTLVFSGTLYAMALGGPRWLGAITPIGGLAFILGWLILAIRK